MVVATHSPEEAEALCQRVAILSEEGSLAALGSPDEIKRLYGIGHTLRAAPRRGSGALAQLEAQLRLWAPPGAVVEREAMADVGSYDDNDEYAVCVRLPPACCLPLSSLAATAAAVTVPLEFWWLESNSFEVAASAAAAGGFRAVRTAPQQPT